MTNSKTVAELQAHVDAIASAAKALNEAIVEAAQAGLSVTMEVSRGAISGGRAYSIVKINTAHLPIHPSEPF